MVALSPRFAVLAAFISLASFSNSPLSVGAAVIPRADEIANTARSFDAASFQRAFRFTQAKAMKRDDECAKDKCPQICLYLGIGSLGKRSQRSPPWSLGKHGDSYTVSHNSKHLQPYGYSRYSRDIKGQEAQSQDGFISIVTDDYQRLGYLAVKNDEKDAHPKSLPVQATEKDPMRFKLVRTSSDTQELKVVTLQMSSPDRSEPTKMWCVGYNSTQSENRNLYVSPCDESGKSGMAQDYAYNETSREISPLSFTRQTDGAQSVLRRKDGDKQANVHLIFAPESAESAKAEDMADVAADAPNGGSSVATMTKTVTVTTGPTTSLSAADIGATPSASASPTATTGGAAPTANTSSSAATSSTVTNNGATPSVNASPNASTINGAAPTAGTANVLDVEVVQASSPPSAPTSASASSVSAATTSTANPQDVASSIANPSPTPSGSSASPSSTNTGSSTSVGSSAPSARAYKWL